MEVQDVTIVVQTDGKTIQIPWKPDMNAQEALETAFNQDQTQKHPFRFALQYYGYWGNEYLGYLVIMMDGTYDDPSNPNDYWLFYVNGNLSNVGIDSYMVNAGDTLEFQYSSSSSAEKTNFQHRIKKGK